MRTGSLSRAVDSVSGGKGRGLVPFVPEKPSAAERALAESQALDPESAGEAFEPMARPGLMSGLRHIVPFGRRGAAAGA